MAKTKKSKDDSKYDVSLHKLVPKHEKLSAKEKENVLKRYNISINELPSIYHDDAAIAKMETVLDDVIRITRISPTAKVSEFYRRVVK